MIKCEKFTFNMYLTISLIDELNEFLKVNDIVRDDIISINHEDRDITLFYWIKS